MSMLRDGTSKVHAIALTRVGRNEELIRFGQTSPGMWKKGNAKKLESVRRLIATRKGLKVKGLLAKRARVMKKEADSG